MITLRTVVKALYLGGWLRTLGLERYEAAFRENEIDDLGRIEETSVSFEARSAPRSYPTE
jgi:hypothetical protein